MSYRDPITVSGSLVTFNDPDGDGRITNLSAAISPVQDLNGYDSPWPAGGGVNLLDPAKCSVIGPSGAYGLTVTHDQATAIWTISGTPTSQNASLGFNFCTYSDFSLSGKGYQVQAFPISGTPIKNIYGFRNEAENRIAMIIDTVANPTVNMTFKVSVAATAQTAWSPYSNICPITGHDTVNVYVSSTTDIEDATVYTEQLGQTVYGGTVDLVTGVLTVDRAMVEIKNAYGSGTYNPTTGLGTFWYTSRISNLNSLNDGVVCNRMITISSVSQNTPNGRISWFANGIIRWTEKRDMSVEDYNAWLNDNPLQVTYKLPTPLTYQLSAQTIQALLGTNNIWADAGDVTVTYQLARHGFEGWLIKVGTEQTEIPINFIRYSTYKVTPDQRMEWSAERNVNGVLQRETVPNMPPKIEFNTKLLTNSDVTALMSILNKSFTVASERKLPVYFYDPENNTYKTCDCYMPDIDFKIRNVDTVKNIINYEELRFAFIGY